MKVLLFFEITTMKRRSSELATEGRVVYSFEKMVKYLIDNEKMTEEEAIEWIEYNTIRALPYMGDKAPIIVKELPE